MSLLRLFTRWKSLRGSAAASSNNPAIQPGRTLFPLSGARSNDSTDDASDAPFMISARICCMLHGMLVMIHILLAISYIFHWEHRVTLPFTPANDDFWSVVLSASLQAFYTIYTAVLLFLTQRLSISRTLVRRVKLTSIHDIYGAWSGLGSALNSLWQQIDTPASQWTTSAVAAYFVCISVLHVTSSTLLQFQTFNTTITTSVPTALGWPDDVSGLSTANWGTITASLPGVKQLPGLVSAGLSNATIYDTPQISPTVGNATVNATTITSRCGLIPNMTINELSTYTGDGLILEAATPPWADQIQVITVDGMTDNSSQATYPAPEVALIVSTLLEVDASIQQEASLRITWEYINSSGASTLYDIEAYFVQCSLSAATTQVVVDMQTNGLRNSVPTSLPSTQWEIYEWSVSNDSSWQSQLGNALTTYVESAYEFFGTGVPGTVSEPSTTDEYIMSLVGLNLSAQYSQWMSGAPPISTFVLSPDKLEVAVAQAVAQSIWTAGRIGTSNGGIETGNGTANAIQEITALRLNVNLLPLLFAAFASVIMLGLALHMTRAFDASHDSQAVIPSADVLQLLWLGHHSAPVREVLEAVEYPMDADLRRAGTRDVCFAKKICEEGIQLSVRNSPDSFAFSEAHSNNPQEYASDAPWMISTRTCCMLHGILVTIHVLLTNSYIFHWEHHVTLPFTPANDDLWSVVLSASLQAFYTIYTAVLLFLTQRLAISRTLARRIKLTSIHDVSGAWSGLGSALNSLWQQIDIPASWWMTSAVATYLACISVLHVVSSTLVQFQTFNTTMSTSVPTALGWQVNSLANSSAWNVNWGAITASLPVVNQLPGLVSAGLSNATIYDTPQTISIAGNATVNATTITSHCGLLPNVTYSLNTSTASFPLSTSGDAVFMTANPPWPDQIHVLQNISTNGSLGLESGVYLMLSTLLSMDASIHEDVSVTMIWDGLTDPPVPYIVKVYFVQCSLSATTAQAVVDMRTNSLWNPMYIPQPPMQWEMYQWTSMPNNTWQAQLGQDLGTPVDSGYEFWAYAGPFSKPSIVDEHIMSLLGLNLTAQFLQYSNYSDTSHISTFVLGRNELEAAVAQAAAQLVWIAGRTGTHGGGLDFGNGMADAVQDIIGLRLNVNPFQLLFATSASVIMLGLALHMTRAFGASHGSHAVIPNTGALQLLWLGHHSASVHEALKDVENPTNTNLRRAGMIDVCFAKTISDEETWLSTRNSTDGLSGQVDRGQDDTAS